LPPAYYIGRRSLNTTYGEFQGSEPTAVQVGPPQGRGTPNTTRQILINAVARHLKF